MTESIIPLLLTFERKCSLCGVRKEFTKYHRDRSRLIRSWCKFCCSEHDKCRCRIVRNARNRIYMREYHQRPEVKIWYTSPKRHAWQREYRKRFRDDPKFKLTNSMREGVRRSLLGNKSDSTFKILGYSLSDLMMHLERLFQPGMSWSNYGKKGWEVDHIIPISKFQFDSVDDLEFKKCWALSNLQPLMVADNVRKFNHIL